MRLLKKIFKIILLLILLLGFFLFGYYLSVTKNVSLDPKKLTLNENAVTLFDDNGRAISNVAYSKETETIENLSPHTKNAFIVVEDKRFYSHHGFDYKRIIKAVLKNAKSRSFKEGASTISQQLIKNTHLTQRKTIQRKLKEMKLTYALEKLYSKDEILEKYLNTIYFGHNCFGIVSASNYYFNKKPSELTLSESAILAGLVKSPNNYSPFKNTEKCLRRRNLVLSLLEKEGYITKDEMQRAIDESLPIQPNDAKNNHSYTIAVFDELEKLAEEYSFTVGGKIEIHTYLNPKLQAQLEKSSKQADCDVTISVLNNENCGIKAYYSTVKNISRQPASTIKPLLVYGPALEENVLSPATPILDEKINFSGYSPKNYDGKYHGYVSTRYALAKSLNVPAVKTLNSLGLEKALNYANKLHLPLETNDLSLSLALGGITKGFTLNELLGGYSTLANNGQFCSSAYIKKIIIDNAVIYERKEEKTQVFSPSTAYLLTDMLKTCVKEGTAKKLSALPFELGAKTGTNGTAKTNLDAYAFSYTTLDSVGVWLGNKDNSPINHTGGSLPCNISFDVHQWLKNDYDEKGISIPNFFIPDSVKKISIDKYAYENDNTVLLADSLAPEEYRIYELFNTNFLPQKQATTFSNPTLATPSIQVNNDTAIITFDVNTPIFYRILVKKYYYATHNSYATHSTVYDGMVKNRIIDKLDDKHSYVYVITPYFKENKGISLYLPAVFGNNHSTPINPTVPPDISSKDWWNY